MTALIMASAHCLTHLLSISTSLELRLDSVTHCCFLLPHCCFLSFWSIEQGLPFENVAPNHLHIRRATEDLTTTLCLPRSLFLPVFTCKLKKRGGKKEKKKRLLQTKVFVFFLTPLILFYPKHPAAVNSLVSSLAAKWNLFPWFEMWRGKKQVLAP